MAMMEGFIAVQLLSDRRPIPVPLPDAELLATELETFGPDDDMSRARKIAERIREAAETVEGGTPVTVRLTDEYRLDVCGALERLFEDEGEELPEALLELRDECRDVA